ncbi:MAG: hypothetical protein A2161_07610 [Candidatus Schekmanbacteria bacterium RBG_13_48_7]|uniref:FAD-binding PCMH-type domain-containing protein n=1 Tax=Candidatus Schekmanbacteria bacterium RBG_13_48_7 TaxID=1817878 RepID=A0A1F7S385_9BACT|nr:MAG: hypothetical protein A2161_07610 [Candidatus Schekmanbacteria bacterium RBG_13_48_7]
MNEIEYFNPTKLREALKLLSRYKEKAAILAGGTELVVDMKSGKRKPQVIINIKNIDSLKSIIFSKNKVKIGPLVTIAEIEDNPDLNEKIPVLCKAASVIGSRQIRNIATIGGNIANASPCADMVPPLIALDARVKLHSEKDTRDILLEDFFLGPGETVAGFNKILGDIEVDIPGPNTRIAHQFITLRRAMDVTIASIVVRIDLTSKGIKKPKIVMGAVAPTPTRSLKGELLLHNKAPAQVDINGVAATAAAECKPISDVRASAEYRREMVRVLTKKALEEVLL